MGWPSWVPLEAVGCLGQVERLAVDSAKGQVLIRTWEAPKVVSCETPIVVAWPMLPDTGYPKPDFTVPELFTVSPSPKEEGVVVWVFLAVGLGSLVAALFLRLFYREVEAWVRGLYWGWRWRRFLRRYHPKRGIAFEEYALAMLDLVAPYSAFNPRSLTPADLSRLVGPRPLQEALREVLLPFYEARYHQQPIREPSQFYRRSWVLLASWRKAAAKPSKDLLRLE